MVCSTDRSKAVVPVLVLLFVALWFILRGDLLYVFLCVILFLCFSVLLVLRLPRLGKRELILMLYVCSVCACLDLSVSSSSWSLGRAAVCDCGTPWTFLLPFLLCRPFWGGCPGVGLALCCFVVCSARRFVVCLSVCRFVLVFFGPFGIAIASLGLWGGGGGVGGGSGEAGLCAFRAFVRFVLVWVCRFPLPLWAWEGLRFVIVTLPGLFSYLFGRMDRRRTESDHNSSSSAYVRKEQICLLTTGYGPQSVGSRN